MRAAGFVAWCEAEGYPKQTANQYMNFGLRSVDQSYVEFLKQKHPSRRPEARKKRERSTTQKAPGDAPRGWRPAVSKYPRRCIGTLLPLRRRRATGDTPRVPGGRFTEDRLLARMELSLRLIREIPVTSLDAYWQQWAEAHAREENWRPIPADPETYAIVPGSRLAALFKEQQELEQGAACLLLPDGARWLSAPHALPGQSNQWCDYVHDLWLEHFHARESEEGDEGEHHLYLDLATFDLHRVWCVTCRQLVDLIDEAVTAGVAGTSFRVMVEEAGAAAALYEEWEEDEEDDDEEEEPEP